MPGHGGNAKPLDGCRPLIHFDMLPVETTHSRPFAALLRLPNFCHLFISQLRPPGPNRSTARPPVQDKRLESLASTTASRCRLHSNGVPVENQKLMTRANYRSCRPVSMENNRLRPRTVEW